MTTYEEVDLAEVADSPAVRVQTAFDAIEQAASAPQYSTDPALVPLAAQVKNHLTHVTYDFRISRDSGDFPYELHRTAAYPEGPTERALHKADRLLDLLQDTQDSPKVVTNPDQTLGEQARAEQTAVLKAFLADPPATYADFCNRLAEQGPEADFPELGWTLKGLYADLLAKPSVATACEASPLLARLHSQLVQQVGDVIASGHFGYQSTLFNIEDAVAFFDIVVRTNDPTAPEPYHSRRFEYNWHTLAEDTNQLALPSMASVTPADLLKVRGVPLSIVGVSTDTLRVDGYNQTPYEFLHHDIDHTRRMNEATLAAIEREGIAANKYAEDATDLLHNVLIPAIIYDETITDQAEYDKRVAMSYILFEILHEDGLDATRDTIAEAILRPPLERMPFEEIVPGTTTVEHYMGPRATVLAHVFRKLAHTFYDLPDARSQSMGSDYVRTRIAIAEGAAELYRLVSDDPIDDESLLATCRELVSTDEGFTDAFIGNFAHDIKRRGVGRSTLRLMVSHPLGVASAVRRARSYGKHVHSLFGYSALEYEDPEALERAVREDLEHFDPEQTAIAIGATPYGIGNMYPVIKDLGFYTLGIVANTALGLNEECAEGVDDIIVVKDGGWGGFRYSQTTSGLLAPTTRVFVGASDSIAAYGGGNITAVTMQEMTRRGKPFNFRPFDMNHRLAAMTQGQRGATGPIDYAGPAAAKWRELQATA